MLGPLRLATMETPGMSTRRKVDPIVVESPGDLLQVMLLGSNRHLITRPLAVPADIQRGDAVAVNKPSTLDDALSVRTTHLQWE
jgi:hypothetical protein